MAEHLTKPGWKFCWDNAVQRLGLCSHLKRTISLSRPYTIGCTVEQVTDTILHEIAHANVGVGESHGPVWKREAIRLGATPHASADPANTPNIRASAAPWVGTCAAGHVSEHRFWRKPRSRRSCSVCAPGLFDSRYLLTYRRVDTLAGVR